MTQGMKDWDVRQKVVRDYTIIAIRNAMISSCVNCDNWAANGSSQAKADGVEECVRYKARPPANVIAGGCPSWSEDIPF